MRTRHFSGRLIGLLAAYLVALQALVLPLSMAPTAAFAGSLCLTEQADGPAQHPVGHDQGCPCCAGCGLQCHVPVLGEAVAPVAVAPQLQVAAAVMLAPLQVASRAAVRTPQIPRGPPRT
jgi:hypothetical protein